MSSLPTDNPFKVRSIATLTTLSRSILVLPALASLFEPSETYTLSKMSPGLRRRSDDLDQPEL
ncbi:hypothetical protein WJ78_16015 [Burkholderia ubonensis]|uniref:Uncharacterized protein n=1 Tax=Burkholderia ubonensis TaxID=101571 RepID=A0A119F567_9BURK|nr:hypothetical protein WJ31_29760 [Burkholderia ubonensis]KVO61099.1 hypothetical protein WJ77_08180 [Burkholderia ubonensis]KVO66130.1 hypothetical protein WJ78_16015 [Burkholderia ubonensis]KVP57468.1 hypothetical protein WJ91_16580 [Burkholderia ubonensis]KVP99828.1 hypothetical protein WJ97_07975 [Burkholderia ubonensis]